MTRKLQKQLLELGIQIEHKKTLRFENRWGKSNIHMSMLCK